MELPDLGSRAELVRRYAHLIHHFGSEIGARPLVRQNGEFFPDAFEQDETSVVRLVRRLQTHAGLADIPLQVRLLSLDASDEASAGSPGGSCSSGGCGSGACATPTGAQGVKVAAGTATRLEEHPEGWVLNVFDVELSHPVALTCKLAQALGRVFLAETESASATVEAPLEVSVDLACVALGLGTLVLEGSYIYGKSCGGPSVTRLTALEVGELAIACSLFIAVGDATVRRHGRRALAELGTTQRALLGEANDWAASNPRIIEQLARDPEALSRSAPRLSDARPWLLRLFDRPARRAEPSLERALSGELGDAELERLFNQSAKERAPAERRPDKDAQKDELRALVDEALRS